MAYNNLGVFLGDRNRFGEAIDTYRDGLRIAPEQAFTHNNLGFALWHNGQLNEAAAEFREAAQLKPDYRSPYYLLGRVLIDQGRFDEALALCQKMLAIPHCGADANEIRGRVMAIQGRIGEATQYFEQAVKADPDDPRLHAALANALGYQGRYREAAAQYRRSLALDPRYGEAQNNLAWLLATCPEAEVRNGDEAVELALRPRRRGAVELANGLDTLAAAYAEAGRYAEAAESARRALELSLQKKDRESAQRLRSQLALYEAGKPFHETPPAAPSAGAAVR
jgi:tetratricopeptide (TPR) repeat protein